MTTPIHSRQFGNDQTESNQYSSSISLVPVDGGNISGSGFGNNVEVVTIRDGIAVKREGARTTHRNRQKCTL
jgi:hypothetical protein